MMEVSREIIYNELLTNYKKDKIRDYLYTKGKELDTFQKQMLESNVNEMLMDSLKNPEILNGICGRIIVEYADTYDASALNKLKNEAKKHKKKSFHIVEIEKINSEMITEYSFGLSFVKDKTYKIQESDVTGFFKIIFSDGSFMHYSKWISGTGKTRSVEGIYATENGTWLKFLRMVKEEKKKTEKPKTGIYRIYSAGMDGGIVYKKCDDLQETPIIHPSTEVLLQDIEYYYSNVSLYTRFGMSGVRKSLMVGPPGTGKTSLAVKVAKKFAKEKCVVFSTSVSDVAAHLNLCSKHKVSTLVILEDAESTLENANSALLNFLDGVDQPKNLLGSYIIMTTNHPDKIEPRILKRPGRVDRIIEFGVLTGVYAVKCADIYFEGILFNDKNRASTKTGKKLREELYPSVNGMSGAEIKELAQSTASFAVSERKEVDIELIKAVKKRMKEDIKNISKYASDQSIMTKRKGVGFEKNEDCTEEFKEAFLEEVESF